MDTFYWIAEYMHVLCGYVFLMFLWPMVVFWKHLRGKTVLYRFSFCTVTQIVIVNAVVLGLLFFRALNPYAVAGVFYGVFLVMLLYHGVRYGFRTANKTVEKNSDLRYGVRLRWMKRFQNLSDKMGGRFLEYAALTALLVFGLMYFSYGAFWMHSYGYGELYVQHAWINGLMEGNLFPEGVGPQAMQCLVACMSMLFGIPVYSVLLYLQCIHMAVFLLSAYFLLREIFHWRCTPLLVLAVYLIWDVKGADLIYGMSRLQWTLPTEFGLYTVFLSALYFVRCLNPKSGEQMPLCKDKGSSGRLNGNLLLLLLSLAASLLIHVYVAVMALLTCFPFLLLGKRNMAGGKYLSRSAAGILCVGLVLAAFFARRPIIDLYRYGYEGLYGRAGAIWILGLSGLGILLGIAGRSRKIRFSHGREGCYVPMVLASMLFILTYAMPYVGLPQLIPDSLFCSVGHMLVLAVLLIPVDVVCSVAADHCQEGVLQKLSIASVVGIYGAAIFMDHYRGYLFCELTRYDAAVTVTNAIIESFPKDSYLIIAPTDERYPLLGNGWHEELITFAENCRNEDFTLPQKYVFLYVEKRPLLYDQTYFFQGPFWLAHEKYAEKYWEKYSHRNPNSGISETPYAAVAAVSEEAAQKELPDTEDRWEIYTQIDNRTILESKVYDWCQRFSQAYPYEMNIYYEDDNFVCYYLVQDLSVSYRLGIE